MPNREQRRSGELDDVGFSIVVNGEPFEIRVSEFSAKDELDFYHLLGLTFFEGFEKMSTFVVAAYVWLLRRKYESRLTYEKVAELVKVSDLESIKQFGGEDDEPAPEPEARFDGRNPERSGENSDRPSPVSPLSTG